jgi:hypothetical protein
VVKFAFGVYYSSRGRTYVHDQNSCFVQLLNHPFGGHTNGADKELRFLFDDDVNQLGELPLGVVVLRVVVSNIALFDVAENSRLFYEHCRQPVG